MAKMTRFRTKICCITTLEEARTAIEFGADALGFVSEMPSGSGMISEDLIAEISSKVPPTVTTILLSSKQKTNDIVLQQQKSKCNAIQFCDRIEIDTYKELRGELPGVKFIQVIHIIDNKSINRAQAISSYVDGLLLDTGNPDLPQKILGGTGRTHDWNISKEIRSKVSVPIFLAGGLNPENVASAAKLVKPFCIDICSGVRTDGVLDKDKLMKFFKSINSI
jgi:phosphoribosylanthranilate isomerase